MKFNILFQAVFRMSDSLNIFFFKKKKAAILQCFLKIHWEAFGTSSFLLFQSFFLLLHFLLFRPVRPTLCKLHILSVLWNCGTTYAMKPSLVVLLDVRELSRDHPIHGFDVVLQPIGQSSNAFSILGFSLAGKRRGHVLIIHPLADKTNNKYLPKPFQSHKSL